jgi:hypothetical protein
MRTFTTAAIVACLGTLAATSCRAQAADTSVARERPFVAGGYDDKPYLEGIFGRISVGGYLEANAAWEREEGATGALGVQLTRWNLLVATDIRERVHIFSELEFEEGGEEVTVELAQVDLTLDRAASFRAGIVLLPLGRFNLAHDAPRNELPGRPGVASELLGVALSQPGMGLFGALDAPAGSRFTYEAYGVTGYHDGIVTSSAEGTRLPAGRRNHEDENASPAWVGRIEWSLQRRAAVGVSAYHGAWNTYRVDGLEVATRQDLAVGVLDAEASVLGIVLSGEAAIVRLDLPPALAGVFASRQGGLYVQAAKSFGRDLIAAMPGSRFTLAARTDVVDFDRDVAGDSSRSLTLGVSFRPVPEAALKLAWVRGETRDRFNNPAANAVVQLGVATYF